MSLHLKYKIGDKLNDWTIININTNSPVKYTLKCKCDKERITHSGKLSKLTSCRTCKIKDKKAIKIGTKINEFFILDYIPLKGYLVRCKCGDESYRSYNRIISCLSCKKCSSGYYVGLKKDGIEFLKRTGRYSWKLRCHCGNIYECKNLGRTNGCGCQITTKYLDYSKNKIGYKFGLLKVISVEKGKKHNILVCKCKCGNIKKIFSGHECKQKSCGCLKKTNIVNSQNHVRAKFTDIEIKSLRELHSTKRYSTKELCDLFDINSNYLSRIINRHIWKHI